MDLSSHSLVSLSAALRRKTFSAVELMETVLGRIDSSRDTLNVVTSQVPRERALEAAHAADERIATGRERPLEGIPLGVKDLEDADGLATGHGSRLFTDKIATQSSTQVQRLVTAGAIVVGKTATPEFGHTALTKSLVHGVTRSPWDLARTPGGSSGGSAAALAGGVLPLVTASDGGGSIRIPASFCGAFGLKPSHGRVPLGPSEAWDYAALSVVGPLTKTVQDAALLLDLTCGAHSCDPVSLPSPDRPYRQALAEKLPSLRLGYSPDLGYATVQSDVGSTVEDAVRELEKLGHEIVPIKGGPPEAGADWVRLMAWALDAFAGREIDKRRDDVTRALVQGIDLVRSSPPTWWSDAVRTRAQIAHWCAQTLSSCDLLLTPTAPYDPPPAKGPFPKQTEGRLQPLASAASFTIPFNFAWLPAATVRAGLSNAGLPVGLQIVGPSHRDDLVLRAAAAFEQARPWHPHWA